MWLQFSPASLLWNFSWNVHDKDLQKNKNSTSDTLKLHEESIEKGEIVTLNLLYLLVTYVAEL